jgi:cytochrome P450
MPRFVQSAYMVATRGRMLRRMHARYGDAFTLNLPSFGQTVVLANPAEIKQLLQTSPQLADYPEVNLGRVLGPGSLFALSGVEHRTQRKLLVPPFHGRRLAAYETIVEDETAHELASWPTGTTFATLPSMMRITLNIILRAVFGAEGEEFALLRRLLPPFVTLGSQLTFTPIPQIDLGRWSPWGRFWAMRRRYDAIVDRLITKATDDKHLAERDDVLAMMVESRYDDGSAMTRSEIADQLLTLLTAGHETTATTLAWAVERLRRHPAVLDDLVDEVDAGGSKLRDAVIIEVQRTRPVIDQTNRQVKADSLTIGRWTLPKGMTTLVSIGALHDDDAVFPNARAFDPTRFVDARVDLYQWIPFGGGHRRCLGAAFATMEMSVVLRTMLHDFALLPTDAPEERRHFRGIAFAPGKGGQAVVRRRITRPGASGATTTTGTRS